MKSRFVYFISTLLLIGVSTYSFSQETSSGNHHRFKVYLNGSYTVQEETEDYVIQLPEIYTREYSLKEFEFGSPSLALEFIKTERMAHELEWMPFKFYHSDSENVLLESDTIMVNQSDSKRIHFRTSFRYQFNYYFLPDARISPYIGSSSQLYYEILNENPKVSYMYPERYQDLGLLLSVIPGVRFNISSRASIIIDIPISVAEAVLEMEHINNPNFTIDQRSTSVLGLYLVPQKYYFRFGLSYSF